MKTDLATSIGAAIAGLVIAYFVTNLFIGPIEDVTYKTVNSTIDASVVDPNPEIFNYRALNPTVEVFIGACTEYADNGECLTREAVEDNQGEE